MKNTILSITLIVTCIVLYSCDRHHEPVDLCSGDYTPGTGVEISQYRNYTFSWCSLDNTPQYRIVIDSTEDFRLPLEDSIVNTNSYFYALSYFKPNSTYYWKVYAVSPSGSESLMFESNFRTRDNRIDYVGTYPVYKWSFYYGFGLQYTFIKPVSLKITAVGDNQLMFEDMDSGLSRTMNQSIAAPQIFDSVQL